MDFTDYVDAVEAGFRAAATGKALAPPAAAFHVPGGSYHAKAAALLAGDPPVMAIKLNGNYPGNPAANGLPTVQGVIYLADATNGRPLALMDSIEITINRTGAATTLAARHLARRNSRVATICGAGVQGRIQAKAIAAAARLDTIHVWDIRPDAAEKLARELAQELKIDVRPSADLAVTRQSDIIVTATSSQDGLPHARPGAARHLHRRGRRRQLRQVGDRAGALCQVAGRRRFARAVCRDRRPAPCPEGEGRDAGARPRHAGRAGGRPEARALHDEAITLFDSSGLGLQDVASAAAIYHRALERGVGDRLPFD